MWQMRELIGSCVSGSGSGADWIGFNAADVGFDRLVQQLQELNSLELLCIAPITRE